jgi:DNA-binding Xre family transcriptional regulator
MRRKDPPGYPGDDAVTWAFAEASEQLRRESGLSGEQIEKNLEALASNPVLPKLSKAFGLRLRAAREERRMTRIQLAEASGMSPRIIGMLERGAFKEVHLGEVIKLCIGLRCDLAKMMDETLADAERLAKR